MPRIHKLDCEQTVNTDLDTAWDFIRSPQNLDRITPDDMPFEIVSQLPDTMYDGLIIEYRVGVPFVGKQTWLSEIKYIRDRHSFVDEQRVGPYKFWYHYHEVAEVEDGIRFTDRVSYIMPFGPLGEIARAVFVKKQLEGIFDYRRQAMERFFGGNQES